MLRLFAGRRTAAAKSSYSETVLKKHPVAYWRLGEKHGPEAADASGNGHHGKYRGKEVFGERGAIKDDPDTAIGVALPGSYVEIASFAQFSLRASGHGLTVEVSMRPDVLVFPGETSDPYVMWLGKGEKDEMELKASCPTITSSVPGSTTIPRRAKFNRSRASPRVTARWPYSMNCARDCRSAATGSCTSATAVRTCM